MNKLMKSATILTALASLAACAPTSGVGVASTPAGDLRATMSWQSNGGRSGVMTAQLSNGESYTGRYFQISQETQVTDLDPLWIGWNGPGFRRPGFWGGYGWRGRRWGGGFGYGGGWGGWDYWGPQTAFVTTYSGRVVANLEGPNGTHMRCTFDLRNPSYGMPGGGQGGCQMPSGQTIDATFERTPS
ncbi:MAG: hypothetical protein ACYCZX_20650 [Rhodospirillaceae bacterium]